MIAEARCSTVRAAMQLEAERLLGLQRRRHHVAAVGHDRGIGAEEQRRHADDAVHHGHVHADVMALEAQTPGLGVRISEHGQPVVADVAALVLEALGPVEHLLQRHDRGDPGERRLGQHDGEQPEDRHGLGPVQLVQGKASTVGRPVRPGAPLVLVEGKHGARPLVVGERVEDVTCVHPEVCALGCALRIWVHKPRPTAGRPGHAGSSGTHTAASAMATSRSATAGQGNPATGEQHVEGVEARHQPQHVSGLADAEPRTEKALLGQPAGQVPHPSGAVLFHERESAGERVGVEAAEGEHGPGHVANRGVGLAAGPHALAKMFTGRGRLEGGDHELEAGPVVQVVGERLEQSGPRAEHDVHRRSGDAGHLGHPLDARGLVGRLLEPAVQRVEDALPGLVGPGRRGPAVGRSEACDRHPTDFG